mmetsp:Transcript_70573/g.169091  ORF Transcript_70573/g.169091 Transcript_70573/m.169091 type:complete len:153 (+) Transcript_70573:170-628(+)|eukprot:CAMPEP_0178437244 /NCGR_PEP_ID=MMETSP0689_2-20121128/34878_1 /TAXON_ID=160604 /ORGANISM="Amphidinium massartii, Strain CS-259" /LENGTH=152 /DNA_ID=CAMNT_0020059411 /DNA_START=79 /DNA_END=537 /DNA_ORIENTATION=+
MAHPCERRLQKELQVLRARPKEEGIVVQDVAWNSGHVWFITIAGAADTLYSEETFTLRFSFSAGYPMESPEVVFIGHPPVHPHVYSNGHICLSILYDHWSPALTVHSVCISILSMLSSCKEKARPPDDADYVTKVGQRSPKLSKWQYDDDSV